MKLLNDVKVFKEAFKFLNLNEIVELAGFNDSEKSLLILELQKKVNKKTIILAPNLIAAGQIENMLTALGEKPCVVKDYIELSRVLTQRDADKKMLAISNEYLNFFNYANFLILLPNVLNQNAVNLKEIENQLNFKVSENLTRNEINSKLFKLGYNKSQEVESEFNYLFLGDILKINVNGKILSVEFFDDQIEKIYFEDKVSLNEYSLLNAKIEFSEEQNCENIFLFCLKKLNPLLFILEPKHITDEIFYKSVELTNEKIKVKDTITRDNFFDKIKENLESFLIFRDIFEEINDAKKVLNTSVGARKYFYDYKSLVSDLIYYKKNNFKVVLFAGSEDSKKSLFDYISKSVNVIIENYEGQEKGIFLTSDYLPMSASFLDDKLVLIGTDDLIKRKNSKIYKYISNRNIYLPKVGDYVVHEFHGIGKCVLLERINLQGHEKDYVVVEYKGGDRLYVPSEQVNLLSAYVGTEETPKLNTIGGVEFAKQKEKVKSSVKKITFDLLKLYAERESKKGFVYEKDNYLYKAFEDAFVYEETEDQLKAIADIKRDMESERILDRLICGDVGYGKTEVALRAAFKAICSGKQVAFLCPTTVLSEQHYNTCLNRFKDFMVNVEVLNRFKSSKKDVDKILADLKEGKIDILCGTHRILNDDVKFKDLGLLILDEEQKFGVEHKEKIKRLKSNIDVLTLSATPIPRTLQMSLSGIRDISLIETPPKNRLPISTYISEYSDKLLVDACKKELARNGQVYIIYNEIKTIEEFANKVRSLIPSANIAVAHADMNEKQLQSIISKMYTSEFDIIISTTIIENGVDNPRANTLIVINADRLGLSELYQLRGRVGRSDRLAYAYFTYEPQKMLTENAYKRLEALSEFTELGSGFKIAMRDLEIRGAGDILGREQHGHLAKVGYDLYNKIVAETVKEIKGEKQENLLEIKMDISLDAYISSDYIKDEGERMATYAKISKLCSLNELSTLKKQVEESAGEMPIETVNLLKIGLLKNLAQRNYVAKVVLNDNACKVILYKQENIVTDLISNALKTYSDYASLKFESEPIIEFKLNLKLEEKLDFMIKFFSDVK